MVLPSFVVRPTVQDDKTASSIARHESVPYPARSPRNAALFPRHARVYEGHPFGVLAQHAPPAVQQVLCGRRWRLSVAGVGWHTRQQYSIAERRQRAFRGRFTRPRPIWREQQRRQALENCHRAAFDNAAWCMLTDARLQSTVFASCEGFRTCGKLLRFSWLHCGCTHVSVLYACMHTCHVGACTRCTRLCVLTNLIPSGPSHAQRHAWWLWTPPPMRLDRWRRRQDGWGFRDENSLFVSLSLSP